MWTFMQLLYSLFQMFVIHILKFRWHFFYKNLFIYVWWNDYELQTTQKLLVNPLNTLFRPMLIPLANLLDYIFFTLNFTKKKVSDINHSYAIIRYKMLCFNFSDLKWSHSGKFLFSKFSTYNNNDAFNLMHQNILCWCS